jgi:hypothetical protein
MVNAQSVNADTCDVSFKEQFGGISTKSGKVHDTLLVHVHIPLRVIPSFLPSRPRDNESALRDLTVSVFKVADVSGADEVIWIAGNFIADINHTRFTHKLAGGHFVH